MVSLNTNPAERRHGTQVKESTFMATPHTKSNLTDSLCRKCGKYPTSDGICLCNLEEMDLNETARPKPFAIVFNSRGELRVRSSDGKRWYQIKTSDGQLTCQCTAALHGSMCYHLAGDPKRNAKGAARFLQEFDFHKGNVHQQRFLRMSFGDNLRRDIRREERARIEEKGALTLEAIFPDFAA